MKYKIKKKEDGLWRIETTDELKIQLNVIPVDENIDQSKEKVVALKLYMKVWETDIYETTEDYYENEDTISERAIIPVGMFAEKENSNIILTGIVRQIEKVENNDVNYIVTVETVDNIIVTVLVKSNELIQNNNILIANGFLLADIEYAEERL